MAATFELSRTFRHRMMCMAREGTAMNFLQIHALALIAEHRGITMKELAHHLKITSPSATSFVNRLVKIRWVERFPDAENRKLVRLKITQTGMRLLRAKKQKRMAASGEIFSLLSPREQIQLAHLLEKLAQKVHSLAS